MRPDHKYLVDHGWVRDPNRPQNTMGNRIQYLWMHPQLRPQGLAPTSHALYVQQRKGNHNENPSGNLV